LDEHFWRDVYATNINKLMKNLLQLLAISNFYGESENIDIAKGKNEIPKTVNEAFKQGIRKIKSRKYGRN